MATAFFGTLVVRNLDGTIQADRFDSSDVTAAYTTWTSNGGNTFLKVKKNGHVVDISTNIVAAGDTKYFKMWLNQQDTGISWVQVLSFPTTDNRFTNMAPIPVKAGDQIAIQAIT